MRKLFIEMACLGIALWNCSGGLTPTEPSPPEFSVAVNGDTLFLRNGTNRAVYYLVTTAERFADVIGESCTGPGCPAVQAKRTRTLFISEEVPKAGNLPVFIHWWHAFGSARSGFRPDSVRTGRLPR